MFVLAARYKLIERLAKQPCGNRVELLSILNNSMNIIHSANTPDESELSVEPSSIVIIYPTGYVVFYPKLNIGSMFNFSNNQADYFPLAKRRS